MAPRQDESIHQDLDISSTGPLITHRADGDVLISLNIEATAAASYAVDVGPDGDTWFEAEATYDQADVDDATDIRDAFELGDRHLRLRVTDAAADGETATITLQEAR